MQRGHQVPRHDLHDVRVGDVADAEDHVLRSRVRERSEMVDDLGDADLMLKAAHGDRDAFAALYRRYHAMVYRFARLMTGSSNAAEDIVQEVFLAVMRDAARYDPARAALPSRRTRRPAMIARAIIPSLRFRGW